MMLKNDLLFTQFYTDPLITSRHHSEKSLMNLLSYAKTQLRYGLPKNFCTPLYVNEHKIKLKEMLEQCVRRNQKRLRVEALMLKWKMSSVPPSHLGWGLHLLLVLQLWYSIQITSSHLGNIQFVHFLSTREGETYTESFTNGKLSHQLSSLLCLCAPGARRKKTIRSTIRRQKLTNHSHLTLLLT